MTKPAAQGPGIGSLDDATVADYLEAVPDFFERHPQLVQRLRLADTRNGGSTVSLIERQVELLRDRNRKLEQRLVEFVENARANDELAEKIHKLTTRLVHARGLTRVVDAIEASLREDFDVQQSVLLIFREDAALAAPSLPSSGRCRAMRRRSAPSRACSPPTSRAAARCATCSATGCSALAPWPWARWRWCRSAPAAASACWPARRATCTASTRP
jgi:hypothetical protein